MPSLNKAIILAHKRKYCLSNSYLKKRTGTTKFLIPNNETIMYSYFEEQKGINTGIWMKKAWLIISIIGKLLNLHFGINFSHLKKWRWWRANKSSLQILKHININLLCIMLKNGQIYFKCLAVFTQITFSY